MNATQPNGTVIEAAATCSPNPERMMELETDWLNNSQTHLQTGLIEEINSLFSTIVFRNEYSTMKSHLQYIRHVYRLIVLQRGYDSNGESSIYELIRYENDIKNTIDLMMSEFDLGNRMVAALANMVRNTRVEGYVNSEPNRGFWTILWMLKILVPIYRSVVVEKMHKKCLMTSDETFVHLHSDFLTSTFYHGWFLISEMVLEESKKLGSDHVYHQKMLANLITKVLPMVPLKDSIFNHHATQLLTNTLAYSQPITNKQSQQQMVSYA